jgi:hypothetical protein
VVQTQSVKLKDRSIHGVSDLVRFLPCNVAFLRGRVSFTLMHLHELSSKLAHAFTCSYVKSLCSLSQSLLPVHQACKG